MECYASKFRTLGWFTLPIGLVAVGWFDVGLKTSSPKIAGATLIVLGLGVALVLLWQMFRRGPIVVFNENGVLDVRNGIGIMNWDDIRFLQPYSFRRGLVGLGVYLRNTDEYLNRLRPWKRVLTKFGLRQGMPFAVITFAGLAPGLEQANKYLATKHPEKLVGV
jgi:hypothetical protein